jgi:hypothetical protein
LEELFVDLTHAHSAVAFPVAVSATIQENAREHILPAKSEFIHCGFVGCVERKPSINLVLELPLQFYG